MKAVSIGAVHTQTHTCNLIDKKQALKMLLFNIQLKDR